MSPGLPRMSLKASSRWRNWGDGEQSGSDMGAQVRVRVEGVGARAIYCRIGDGAARSISRRARGTLRCWREMPGVCLRLGGGDLRGVI